MARTRTTPTKFGWYWFSGLAGARPVYNEIAQLDYDELGRLNVVSIGSRGEDLGWPDIRDFIGEWDGPIEAEDWSIIMTTPPFFDPVLLLCSSMSFFEMAGVH